MSVTLPEWSGRPGDEIGFDLIVNEMYSDRTRRAGQLVWSGGGGWVYLRGDRHRAVRWACWSCDDASSPGSPRRQQASRGDLRRGADDLPVPHDPLGGLPHLGRPRPRSIWTTSWASVPSPWIRVPAVTEAAIARYTTERRPTPARGGGTAGGGDDPAHSPRWSRCVFSRPVRRRWARRCAWPAWRPVVTAFWAAATTAGSTGARRTEATGVPAATRALYAEIPFNDPERARELIRAAVIASPPWCSSRSSSRSRAGSGWPSCARRPGASARCLCG